MKSYNTIFCPNSLPRVFIIMIACVILTIPSSLQAASGGAIHLTIKSSDHADHVLSGATVRLLELDRRGSTDANGEYTFSNLNAGTFTVFVRMIGYASATQSVQVSDQTTEVSVSMHESAVEEEEVVVSASPYARAANEQYQSSESKSQLELGQSAGSSFAEKISDMPGLSVRYMGSAPSRPVMRGLTDNEVLVLENGLRNGDLATYDPAHAVPVENESISQIDVVRGPASIMYGPNAIGGLVNIQTNTIPTASSRAFSGRATLGGNSVNDEYSGYFNGVYSHGGSAFGILGGGVHSQNIHIPENTYVDPGTGTPYKLDRLPQTFNHSSEAGLGYSYTGDFGMIGVGAKHYEMNYGIPGVPPNDDWMNNPPGTSRIAQLKNNFDLQSLFLINNSPIKQIKFNGTFVDYNHGEYPTEQDSSGVADPQANYFHKQTFNAMVQVQDEHSSSWHGTFGLWTNYEALTIGGDEPLGPKSSSLGLAGFLYEEYMAAQETHLQGAVRFDYTNVHGMPDPNSTDSVFQVFEQTRNSNAFTASLGVLQEFTPRVTASINLGRSFRAPTVQELFADGPDGPTGTYTLGDLNLVPETGFGIDFSLKGNFDQFNVEISEYMNVLHDYLYSYLRGDTILDLPVRVFDQTNALLQGYEVSAAAQVTSKLSLKASVNFVSAQDTKALEPLPFTPPLKGLLRMKYQDEMYYGMVECRLAAKQDQLAPGETETPGYGVVNIGAGVRFAGAGMTHNFGLACDNVFNKTYADHLSLIKDFLPMSARGFRLNYTVMF